MSNPGVSRWIRSYDKLTGKLRAEYRLPDSWNLPRLQQLLGLSASNPMYDCFPVDEITAKVLEPSIGTALIRDDQELFLEADADE